jgi:hypothetical protein
MNEQPWLVKSIAVGEVPIEVRKLNNAELAQRIRFRRDPPAPYQAKAKPSKVRPRVYIKPFRRP